MAYIRGEAPPVDEPAIQPCHGMMIFSDESHVRVKTGTRADLFRLAQVTGLGVVPAVGDAFWVPYASHTSTDDAVRWGYLILTFAQAVAQIKIAPIPADESPEV